MMWKEVVPLKQVKYQEIISFLQQNVSSRFDIPTSLVVNNATYFSSLRLEGFALENGIVLKH